MAAAAAASENCWQRKPVRNRNQSSMRELPERPFGTADILFFFAGRPARGRCFLAGPAGRGRAGGAGRAGEAGRCAL